jgi:hypothetical protein
MQSSSIISCLFNLRYGKNTVMKCPKCQYKRTEKDNYVMAEICPGCGIVYKKWIITHHPELDKSRKEKNISLRDNIDSNNLFKRIFQLLLWVPEKIDPLVYWGRVIIYIIFFIWGWYFITAGINWEKIGGSFLHNAILPFHEFGHVLFMPFGRFMSILGGSLFQILLPLFIMMAFIIQNRDNFAASMMLWWTGQSFIDLSPYIADAPYRNLPLIMGMGENAHDWGNLLTMTGNIDKAASYANTSFTLGVICILSSYVWGAYLINKQKKYLR